MAKETVFDLNLGQEAVRKVGEIIDNFTAAVKTMKANAQEKSDLQDLTFLKSIVNDCQSLEDSLPQINEVFFVLKVNFNKYLENIDTNDLGGI